MASAVLWPRRVIEPGDRAQMRDVGESDREMYWNSDSI